MDTDAAHDLDHEAALVAADEAMRAGIDLGQFDGAQSDGVRESIDCLERLERLWPRRVAAQRDPLIPARIGRFQIQRVLGRGGFGVVLLANDPVLHRSVALKLPRPEVLITPEQRERFVQEARAAGQLEHPQIVPVFEAGEVDGVLYIASAYCPDGDLADWLRRVERPIDVRLSARIVATLAEAVQHAHSRGIIHRDLKPSNVLLIRRPDTEVVDRDFPFDLRITDFGLAKVTEGQLAETGSSVLIGTPQYMSPEQAEGRGRDGTAEVDVYGLGAILYELLTGQALFGGDNLLAMLNELQSVEPAAPSVANPHVNRDLDTVCLKCLHKRPEQRYPSAGELAADLRRSLQGETISARRLTMLERLGNWSQKPERIRDAGLASIATGAGMLVWNAFMFVTQLTGTVREEYLASGIVLWALAWIACVYMPFAWLGWRILNHSIRSLWICTAIAVAIVCFMVPAIIWPILQGPTGVFYTETLPNNLLVVDMHAGVAAANVLGLRAHYSQRRIRARGSGVQAR